MAKVARLVEFSIMVRVIVDEKATDDEIIKEARPKVISVAQNELGDNLVSAEFDEECPFGTFNTDRTINSPLL